ncbi:MAG: tryptophan-rich sensory protein [Pseudomonadota bacterium]|nr:tryptophan-rich sensory protein [Pseudomonadota bacterium]
MTGLASKSQLRMSFLRVALVTVPLVVLLGTLSGRASGSGYGNPWFDALAKPDFMPPGWVFGAAWTILYILLGLVLAMLIHARGARRRERVIALFLLQLALNYAWSPLFFALHQVGTALTLIGAMIILTAALIVLLWPIRRVGALLMVPYLLWLCFAGLLTASIATLNPNAAEVAPQQESTDIVL